MSAYLRLTYLLPADLEELFVADLWLEGTLGVQTLPGTGGRARVEAWFPAGAGPDLDPEWRARGAEREGEEVVPAADWLAEHRRRAEPFAIGRSLFVDPGEPDGAPVDVPAGRRLLRLPARAAFGTGSHESTSLALELLDDLDLAGRRVLDVGTGTGVLSFAALLRGARLAVGFDRDLAAPVHGRDNSRLNGLHPRLFAGTVAAVREGAGFDLALVNVVPEEILAEMPAIAGRLAPAGEVIFSGILAERGPQVVERLRARGFAPAARREAGGWIAYRFARAIG